MKLSRLFILLVALTFSHSAWAQEATWYTDVNKAIELSQKQKKPIMLFFTGSDWCGWCIKLQNEVFKQEAFVKWANQNVILVELDYPRRKSLDPQMQQQNAQMQQLFQVRGYPTVFFVNPEQKDGKVNLQQLGKAGYVAGGAETWINTVNNFVKKS